MKKLNSTELYKLLSAEGKRQLARYAKRCGMNEYDAVLEEEALNIIRSFLSSLSGEVIK